MENNNKQKDQDDTECESMGEDTTNDDGTLPFSPRGEELLSPEISLMSPFLSISSTSPKKKVSENYKQPQLQNLEKN